MEIQNIGRKKSRNLGNRYFDKNGPYKGIKGVKTKTGCAGFVYKVGKLREIRSVGSSIDTSDVRLHA